MAELPSAHRFEVLARGYSDGMEYDEDESGLPEDAPPEQVSEDEDEESAGGSGMEAEENAGVPNEGGQATGNPANAG